MRSAFAETTAARPERARVQHRRRRPLVARIGGRCRRPGRRSRPARLRAGVVSKLFEPLGVTDVFGQSQTTASQIRYGVEGTATSGATGVAEGAAKPESTIAMSETTEAIRKFATMLPVSDELLEDAPSIQSYLNDRLACSSGSRRSASFSAARAPARMSCSASSAGAASTPTPSWRRRTTRWRWRG